MKFDMRLVGRRISAGIADAGLDNETFAEEIGISRHTLSNWTCGRSTLNLESAVKIADFFGWPLDYLAIRETPKLEDARVKY